MKIMRMNAVLSGFVVIALYGFSEKATSNLLEDVGHNLKAAEHSRGQQHVPLGPTVDVFGRHARRRLPDRAIFGQNFTWPSRAAETWDQVNSQFKQPFWDLFSATNPGILRFPGGNWSHGYHFNLAREGIKHRVNTGEGNQLFRPQHFLKLIRELPDAKALIHIDPTFSSAEEAAAFVAYMIGTTNDAREIGLDLWGRIDPATGEVIDWKTVGYWAALRQGDGEGAYAGTLHFQVGNEDWFGYCRSGSCNGWLDYYGRHRTPHRMAIEDTGLKDEVSGLAIEAYWPNYKAVYQKVRGL